MLPHTYALANMYTCIQNYTDIQRCMNSPETDTCPFLLITLNPKAPSVKSHSYTWHICLHNPLSINTTLLKLLRHGRPECVCERCALLPSYLRTLVLRLRWV